MERREEAKKMEAMRRKVVVPVLFIIALLIPSVLLAAVCPDFAPIGSLKAGAFEPFAVAVDGKGNSYATDYFNDTLSIFSYKGLLLKTEYIKPPKTQEFSNLSTTGPLGVAVDDSGRIYVGRTDDRNGAFTGEVTVYDSTLKVLFKLGKGYGEFEYPASIAVAAGKVYVADSRTNLLKAYDAAAGGFLFSVGGYNKPYCPSPKNSNTSTCQTGSDGTCFTANDCNTNFTYSYAPGNLVKPVGVAIHPATGDLYVADKAMQCPGNPTLVDGSCYNWGVGAGVHIFKNDGTFVKRFGLPGDGKSAGNISQPAGIAIVGDAANGYKVAVSDSSSGYLHIFDDAGNTLCLGPRPGQPQGLASGADGRLLTAALKGVSIFGVGSYVGMNVTPDPLVISSSQCENSAVSGTLSITNNGPGALDWSIVSDRPEWIVPAQITGSINGKSTVNVAVSVDPNGTMEGKLTVTAQGVTEDVEVLVNLAKPALTVSPEALYFDVKGLEIPAAKTLNINLSSDASGTLNWNAASGSDWLSISPATGPSSTISVANVTVDPKTASDGATTGYLTISAGCAMGSPAIIPVKLTKEDAKGTLKVSTNVPAPVYISGGMNASGSTGGASPYTYIITLPTGAYTVSFGEVKGYKTPASAGVTVTSGNMVEAAGSYQDLKDKKGIIATMGSGQWFVPDELKVFNEAGGLERSLSLGSGVKSRTGSIIKEGRVTAAGDVDGDGGDEIVIGSEKGVITAVEPDGTPVPGFNFAAFSYSSGLSIAVADLDGDGTGEVVVGAGAKAGNPAAVRVFSYKGGIVADTGVNFLAFDSMYGVTVAAGDVDGDGLAEIITTPGGGNKAAVRIWKVDTAGEAGWSVTDAGGFSGGLSVLGPDVAAGDVDGDGIDEVIVASIPSATDGTATITAHKADGSKILEFVVSAKGGVDITAGDTDMDGIAEIIVGEGTDIESPSTVRVYKNGKLSKEFLAFGSLDIYGVRVSLGRVGGAK